jgi:hypothetical protein
MHPHRYGSRRVPARDCGVLGWSCPRCPFLSMWGCSVLFVAVRQLAPEGLVDIPPGPRLAHVLSGIDLARLSGFDCVEVLKAWYRQLNHDRTQLMATMVEVGSCGVARRLMSCGA